MVRNQRNRRELYHLSLGFSQLSCSIKTTTLVIVFSTLSKQTKLLRCISYVVYATLAKLFFFFLDFMVVSLCSHFLFFILQVIWLGFVDFEQQQQALLTMPSMLSILEGVINENKSDYARMGVFGQAGGAAFVIHDSRLGFLAAGGLSLLDSSVPETELYAAWVGIKYARQILHLNFLIIEDDSATIVSWIRQTLRASLAQPIIRDIGLLLQGCAFIAIV